MLLDFLKPGLRLSTHLAYPSCRSILQLGMIFVFPRSLGGAECVELLDALDFTAGYLGQERMGRSQPAADGMSPQNDNVLFA